ncbi:MAG TPA: DUF1223 domain-containing protein [Burkholderiaceae bacterium]|nr:DUF1223 domain-containing protein [Burkholderiaceae bacterium]
MRHLVTRAAVAVTIAITMPNARAASCQATSPKNTVALVELYTSQGCSSCPPADRWLSLLPSRIDANRAIPLALHVGYWDYIGWKDPFAKREFNDRQSQLAALNRSNTRYTPGVFVQGRETNWSSSAFDAQLRAVNQKPATATITLDNVETQSGKVRVRAHAELTAPNSSKNPRLIVALVQNGISTKVTAGENRGEMLANDRVTRAWSGPLPLGTRTVSLEAPPTGARDLALVAFVEDDTGVLQALQLPLATCS